ncbi:acyl--CoA ligase [Methylocella sp.]|jgi:acyl-CoA synthetase (AMP-forming)/AMP-acid ligase II|uniref:acyl--CoA ligase n=1 Tax=Methylocella sp. TaxID=1978226 RepID=UPI003C15E522
MTSVRTFEGLLASGRADDVAIAAPNAAPLTYAGLRALVAETIASLNQLGIARNDRVAIVLPNGPEMATAFIAIASGATSAPLNPTYRTDEFEFYMSDLNARALIVEEGSSSPALAAAKKLGITVLTLAPDPKRGAGAFTLSGEANGAAALPGRAEASDVALILHTSGTTSRPKIVPLTQANVAKSADNIAATLEFTASDRGLNVMPLFHIHGLIAGLLAPLSRGGSVFCTPGFNALKFFAAMEESNPTWYTAVPTMHQAILTRAGHNKDVIARHPLRFIRSSSSSLPPQVITELEATFHAPVIEAYGMTEAAHQMASNPLHGVRKLGSVGIAAGPEVAIMDEDGKLLGAGEVGEIVIRGDNVTAGYENNPRANAEAFANGWFRTGDQGVIDSGGYVSLTGRLKEIINRGGEKISPREVDEALMDHPAILQVVTFAVPHDKLGEDVAAAVVLREGITATEQELRAFLSQRIAAFKTPRKILFLTEIPKGATGKLQRIGLAQKLGLC